jgi:hypothetical protein
MARKLVALSLLFVSTVPAAAQDMPLSQILIDGEGWRKVSEPGKKPQRFPAVLAGTRGPQEEPPTCYLVSGGTLYAGYENAPALVTFVLDGDRTPRHPEPYAPLRRKRGEKGIRVAALEADRDGRVYAATQLGIQVFDPIGRLCGVLHAPKDIDLMLFEGDELTVWVGDTKYARKLRTRGVE